MKIRTFGAVGCCLVLLFWNFSPFEFVHGADICPFKHYIVCEPVFLKFLKARKVIVAIRGVALYFLKILNLVMWPNLCLINGKKKN